MGSFKIELNARKLEQAIKKQQQEAKRLAERQAREAKIQTEKNARIAVAKSIIEKQPVLGGIKMLDKNSEELLKILLKMYDDCKCFDIHADYDEIPEGYQSGLTQILDNLKQYGMIFRHIEFLGGGFNFSLSPQALTYFADKEKALKDEQDRQMAQNINIQTLSATGSNINFGTITNSTLTTQNIVSEIEKQIEEQGGDDKDELKDLLEEVKELCESIKTNNPLPKRANLMTKISNHLEKHGWFYGAVVQLLGTAAMSAMMGAN